MSTDQKIFFVKFFGICFILFLITLTLKLTGVMVMPWWAVIGPLWIPPATIVSLGEAIIVIRYFTNDIYRK